MSSITITCPECHAEFDAAEQLDKHFQEFKLKEKELEQQKLEFLKLQNDKHSDEKEIEELNKRLKNSEDLFKTKMEAQIDASKKEAFAEGVKSIEIEIKSIKKEAHEAAKEEMRLEIKKEREKAYQSALLVAEQNYQDKQEIEITKLKNEIAAEKIEKERMRKHIDELRDKSHQRNVELQGEAQEVVLEEILHEKFPNDTILEVKRGASGHDCTLEINNGKGEAVTKVAFESKNTKHFSNEWIERLNKTLLDKNIRYGIIASRALPKDFEYFEWKYENICIVPFRRSSIVMIAEMIRKMCLEEYSVRKSTLISDSEKESTYQRLTSPELKMQITSFMRSYLATQDNINNDESTFAKSILNRQINLHEQKVQIKKIFKFMSGTDSKLADNLIFTDEELSKTRNISKLRTIKGRK